jgi:hypothetical protein
MTDKEAQGLDVTVRGPADGRGDKQEVLVLDADCNLLETDCANLMSLKSREQLVTRLCAALGLSGAGARHLGRKVKEAWLAFYKAQQEKACAGTAQRGAAELLEETPPQVREAAETALAGPGLLRQSLDDVKALGAAGERRLLTALFLVGVSRNLPRPLSARVHGLSASGKSFLIDTVARLFPPEALLFATRMTAQSLYHMPQGALRHRWVIAGERSRKEDDDAAEATRALREMQASGRLSKLMPVKLAGELVTVQIEQEGPIAFTESTTRGKVFDEDANRCISLYTDETRAQTEKVVRSVAAAYAGGNGDASDILNRHWAMQRLLRPCPVVVPYAGALADLLRCDQVEMRRGVAQVLSCVQALALLHQYQRGRDPDGRLLAAPEDYDIARRLLDGPMARLMGGVSQGAARFLKRLRDRFAGRTFTAVEARLKEKGARSGAYAWLTELHEAGLVKLVSEGRGRVPAAWELAAEQEDEEAGEGGKPGESGPLLLPTVEEVMDAWTQTKA